MHTLEEEELKMKNYVAPEMKVVLLDVENVITASVIEGGDVEVNADRIF